MKNIRPIIDEMVKTATDLNVHRIDYTKGNMILVEDYYKLKRIVKTAYEQNGLDTKALQNYKFSKLFDSMVNDDYLTYYGLCKFIKLLADIDMCHGVANVVEVITMHTAYADTDSCVMKNSYDENDDEEDTNDETDN